MTRKVSTVGLAIEVIFIATLGVAAVGLVVNANYTLFDSVTTLLFKSVLVIIIAVAFLLIILNRIDYHPV